jgi:dihydropteroate synthase
VSERAAASVAAAPPRDLLVLETSRDPEGLARYRVRLGARFAALRACAPEGFTASQRDAREAEIDARFSAGAEPLAREIAQGLRRFERARFELPGPRRTLVLERRSPRIVGILNRTPDSFSDGGRWVELDDLYRQAEELLAAGATWLDLGGESTRPGAAPVAPDEELARVIPAVEGLARRFDAWISIDTRRAAVARAALAVGADQVNDVSAGRADEHMLATCAELGAPVVLNHMRGTPETMQAAPNYGDVLDEVAAELHERLVASLNAGIALPRIALDPGLGFGKRFEDNLRLLDGVAALRTYGCPLFVGASRKSFLGTLLDGRAAAERDDATSATTAWLVARGVSAIRVHDARRASDAARVAARLAELAAPTTWIGVEPEAREERLSG